MEEGLIHSRDIIQYVNATNVNTRCIKPELGSDMARYPLEALQLAMLGNYPYDDDMFTERFVHCIDHGALLIHAPQLLVNAVAAQYSFFRVLDEADRQHVPISMYSAALDWLYRTLAQVGPVGLKRGVELISRGARMDVTLLTHPELAEWKRLLLRGDTCREACTIIMGCYRRSKSYNIPKDVLLMIAKSIYKERIDQPQWDGCKECKRLKYDVRLSKTDDLRATVMDLKHQIDTHMVRKSE